MKGWIGRWLMLPSFNGCKSESGVAIATAAHPRRQLPASTPRNEERVKNSLTLKTKNSFRPTFHFRKTKIGRGIHGLIRRLGNDSPVSDYRDEEGETEMEIGFPTDVKHLTHIGFDGSVTTINKREMEAPESMPLPSISHRELEMAMATQAR